MDNKIFDTKYAPAKRSDKEELERQSEMFWQFAQIKHILNSIPDMLVVLNTNRQIIYGNEAIRKFTGIYNDDDLYGLRIGEALGCSNAGLTPGGCGTSVLCSTCGAVNAILSSLNNMKDVQDCSITCEEKKETYDLRVWSNPVNIDGENFIILSMSDISNENRRKALERIFFHDILNTAGGLVTVGDILRDEEYMNKKDLIDLIGDLSTRLMDEINEQKQLLAAENGELSIEIQPVEIPHVITQIVNTYKNHNISKNRSIIIDEDSWSGELFTDATLLKRILGNMVKNALEASNENEAVTIRAAKNGAYVKFDVHNEGYMERKVQYRVFQRSFSTKGRDRGLGTYSIKLLTEKYLGGNASFRSSETGGTIFTIKLPLKTTTNINDGRQMLIKG